ncbi:hypothetical protein B0A55_09882 [Friedmanniomyces simplex]|uniref:Uncharacterized protein n=1 Tax=Friedmanniomyces simplex TaxID=329884 RepID=A0A4U0WRH2_9PEZI|nr:hypothetical protein B0A55_09882 [Friedmanniomyces simplex]
MALAAIFIWHFCIYEREQKLCTRDAVAPSQALLLHNSTVAFPTLGVSASPDPKDASAWFSVAEAGKDGAKVAGVWTGFPVACDDGMMRGNFSVHIPGVDDVVAGTWISVHRDSKPDEKKAVAFDAVVKTVRDGRTTVETTLDEVLDAAVAAMQ